MICTQTSRLLKVGYAYDLPQRKAKYIEDGCVNSTLIPIAHLGQLELSMDSFQQQKYRTFRSAIRADNDSPPPYQRLCEMIVERGGEELGIKAKMIHQIAETGVQYSHSLSSPAELLVCDVAKYQKREEIVVGVVEQLVESIRSVLDATKDVHLDCTSSYPTAYQCQDTAFFWKENLEGILTNTKCILEYIFGHPLDIRCQHFKSFYQTKRKKG